MPCHWALYKSTRFCLILYSLVGESIASGDIMRSGFIWPYRVCKSSESEVSTSVVVACFLLLIFPINYRNRLKFSEIVTKMSAGELGNPLRKFKLVFLGEQSGEKALCLCTVYVNQSLDCILSRFL